VRHDIAAPTDLPERFLAAFLRLFLRVAFRPWIGPRMGPAAQRRWLRILALLMPGRVAGVASRFETISGLEVEILSSKNVETKGVVLYLHGGGFCWGDSPMYRDLCSHIALESGMPVWIPNYRLAPEHPYPCALEDALTAYDTLLQRGYSSNSIVLAGDSAGGALSLALAIHLNRLGRTAPAALALISPFVDGSATHDTTMPGVRGDPMITRAFLDQCLQWFKLPPSVSEFTPLNIDLSGLPPILIQAGDEEILFSDSIKLEAHAQSCKVPCRLEIYKERWHVFHLQAFYLRSSRQALKAMATFARNSIR
jgi:acetyl esterase/lipase